MKQLANCNHCAHKTCLPVVRQGKAIFINKTYTTECPGHVDPTGKFMLAELALAHPQGLHDALSALPFRTDLSFHLKRR